MPIETTAETATTTPNVAPAHQHDGHAVPEQSRADRTTSYNPDDFAVPHGREEEWRFTPLDRLRGLLTTTPTPHPAPTTHGDQRVRHETTTREDARTRATAGLPADRAAALAEESCDQVTLLTLPTETELTEPFYLRQEGKGTTGPTAGHTVIHAEPFSTGTVVLHFTGRATLTDRVEVVAQDGAQLTIVTIHEWDEDTVHLSEHDVLLGRDATVRHITATLGGNLVRQGTNARYTGPGGTFEGLGVYFADDSQHIEHRLFVDHSVPRCTSNVVYKGALQGETAHTVWVGDVLIRAAAEGTDTYELNRNLVLTDGARADSVPNLEIETGEIVGAGHASATGRFDDEQLFYLMARGIPEAEARKLVVRAFFGEIVQKIGIPEISEHLMSAVDDELAKAGS
ncbi:Iron-regulated ABC transporter permease protein SufD [Austwickia chelonae]|uniref:Iron-sulfur cluster assembly protein SufD n=1 Tax=Austwickia chelonae NBRC 105200 TaxID=1184607 RepID=K6ULF0_9MICO|nr:Fe-S cluster assembly protein SufD [Austwickia chelonae]GAB77191.1 iron-sulfur cluster assembly protein SufD [Austwickia chelonae NBRC 105200]SEW04820.1 Iron-regulated ABC transporter permease protein SufD [Austwickia chelonae]